MADRLTVVLFALAREAHLFRQSLPPGRRIDAAPCPAWASVHPRGNVLVLLTGMGPAAMRRALAWLFDPSRPAPTRVVSAGFCGGLNDAASVGALIAPAEVVDLAGEAWRTANDGAGPRLVSVSAPVLEPEARRELGKRFGAVAVDMESATVAQRCAQAGVPFVCLRAVSDDPRSSLSAPLAQALAGEQVRLSRLLAAVARRPMLLRELFRLARQSKTAARALAGGLRELLDRD